MKIKTVTEIVPEIVTVNREVKTRTVILTEREAILIRDILGSNNTRQLAKTVIGGFNRSNILTIAQGVIEVDELTTAFFAFSEEVNPSWSLTGKLEK